MIFSSRELALRLETAEALNQTEFARAYNQFHDSSEGAYKKINTGYAVFVGVESPLTQAFGLGLDGPVTDAELAELEEFFKRRGAPANVETSHLADMSLTRMFMDRGYRVTEYSDVLAKSLDERAFLKTSFENDVREIGPEEVDTFAAVVAEAFVEGGPAPQSLIDLFKVFFRQSNCACFGAFRGGKPVGGGALFIKDGVALLAGASTLPSYRNLGVQTDLLKARIDFAARGGCDLAAVTTAPGSVSQRNAQKRGFNIVYSRTKYTLEW
ncbi:MAG TPA: GNAT family N-acetyltransferase [Blastocatellia bacterium]|jgi:GNAT superfamily N-acetyltransferase|nr:GNAT family N-acetyltransferase [Blastocatellia bacterium]